MKTEMKWTCYGSKSGFCGRKHANSHDATVACWAAYDSETGTLEHDRVPVFFGDGTYYDRYGRPRTGHEDTKKTDENEGK